MSVYLDHAATTPMIGPAVAAFQQEISYSGNASSLHASGRRTRRVVEQARDGIAAAAGAHPSEVIFLSGGTEADNLAVKGLFWSRRAADPRRKRILVSAVEHPAVAETVEWLAAHEGAEPVWLPVRADGRLDLDAYRDVLENDPGSVALVTVMWANNVMGTLQPIPEVVAMAADHGVPVHSDAVQAFGAVPVDFAASGLAAMSVSAHKLGGPVGIGALLLGREMAPVPMSHGGGHERGLRSGTLPAASIASFAAAVQEVVSGLPEESARLSALRDRLIRGVRDVIPEAKLSGNETHRLPGNVHFTFPGCEGDSLLFLLDTMGIEASTGSACTAGVPRTSSVLLAMGLSEEEARGAQRFTLGHSSTESDVDALLKALPAAYQQAGHAGMAGHISSIETAGTAGKS
ncbi:cysteine desulfurase family protein [Acaricomes phytoseiuli]|uniref:cysteine desulfurase family protein n=1 Tax=Acaricomes phytoseiuli TaxID=291968 RepID=UPI000379CCAE|nr:cysteine desulfurase family protein [Acaricomes phytoseiuli]